MTGKNYESYREIQKHHIKHPEGLPEPAIARLTSFGFQNVRADWYRLQTIQYIG